MVREAKFSLKIVGRLQGIEISLLKSLTTSLLNSTYLRITPEVD